MSGGWDQALDAMTDLIHQFRSQEGQDYLTAFAQSIATNGHNFNLTTGEVTQNKGTEENFERAGALVRGAMATVPNATPIWVSDDVVTLIEAAADPDIDKPFEPQAIWLDDLFVPNGFVLLARPLFIRDGNGKLMGFRAFSWTVAVDDRGVEAGVHVALWSHDRDRDDSYDPAWDGAYNGLGGSRLILADASQYRFGDEANLAEPSSHELAKYAQVLWALAKQEIARPVQERAQRPTWKRARKTWREIKLVTVLTLRKVKPQKYEGEGGDVEWSHRWIVRGHWRDQPRKVDGKWVKHQIYIESYVKGPASKPLVVKRHAIEFTR